MVEVYMSVYGDGSPRAFTVGGSAAPQRTNGTNYTAKTPPNWPLEKCLGLCWSASDHVRGPGLKVVTEMPSRALGFSNPVDDDTRRPQSVYQLEWIDIDNIIQL